MDWKSTLGAIAPVAANILETFVPGSKLAVDALAAVSTAIFGHPDAKPDEVAAAIQKGLPPEAVAKLAQVNADLQVQLAQVAAAAEKAQLEAANTALTTVNATMQVEDKTRSFSWRDYWGYVSGTGFAFVVAVVCYIVGDAVRFNHYESLSYIPQIVGAFATLFGIAAGVLGVQSAIETHHAGMADRIAALGSKTP